MVKGVCVFLLAVVYAVLTNLPKTTGLLKQIEKNVYNSNELGSYSFEYTISDGTFRKEDGGLLNTKGSLNFVVRGEYGYIDPAGQHHYIRYVADKNGFRPQSDNNDVANYITKSNGAIYTYEDLELRRLFPSEFPQDTVRKSGFLEPEHLGRYNELTNYLKYPKSTINSHFEELACFREDNRKVCRLDVDRYSPEENQYYMSKDGKSHVDRQRVYCFMLLCFTEDELDRVVASF